MQGTQYAPRESILCMEHFVALHCSNIAPVVLCAHSGSPYIVAQGFTFLLLGLL